MRLAVRLQRRAIPPPEFHDNPRYHEAMCRASMSRKAELAILLRDEIRRRIEAGASVESMFTDDLVGLDRYHRVRTA
jgi:hypothetical protein